MSEPIRFNQRGAVHAADGVSPAMASAGVGIGKPHESAVWHVPGQATYNPSEMQHVIAHAQHARAHHVQLECRRMGGGCGGKEAQSARWASCAAIAAKKLNRPVKLRTDRDDDMLLTGKHQTNPPLNAPATSESILKAIAAVTSAMH